MNDISWNDNPERVTARSFEAPPSPEWSYDNPPVTEIIKDRSKQPPLLPPHLHHGILSIPPIRDGFNSLPLPLDVTLNHLYIEHKPTLGSVVAFGSTHRYRDKYVTLVLYKPV